MKKVNLEGLNIAIKELNKTILISRSDDFTKKYINKDADIIIEILKDGRVVNGTSTENLVRGLIVCSNYYLPDNAEQEIVKKYKTRLEKLVRKGMTIEIKKMNTSNDLIQLIVYANGVGNHNFYAHKMLEVLKLVEDCGKGLNNNL